MQPVIPSRDMSCSVCGTAIPNVSGGIAVCKKCGGGRTLVIGGAIGPGATSHDSASTTRTRAPSDDEESDGGEYEPEEEGDEEEGGEEEGESSSGEDEGDESEDAPEGDSDAMAIVPVDRKRKKDGEDDEEYEESDEESEEEEDAEEEDSEAGEDEAKEDVPENEIYARELRADDDQLMEDLVEERAGQHGRFIENRLNGGSGTLSEIAQAPDEKKLEEEGDDEFAVLGYVLRVMKEDREKGMLLKFFAKKSEQKGVDLDTRGGDKSDKKRLEDAEDADEEEEGEMDEFIEEDEEEEEEEDDDFLDGEAAVEGGKKKKSKGPAKKKQKKGEQKRELVLNEEEDLVSKNVNNIYFLVGDLCEAITCPLFDFTLRISKVTRPSISLVENTVPSMDTKLKTKEQNSEHENRVYYHVDSIQASKPFRGGGRIDPPVLRAGMKRSEYYGSVGSRYAKVAIKLDISKLHKLGKGSNSLDLEKSNFSIPLRYVLKNVTKDQEYFDRISNFGIELTDFLEKNHLMDRLIEDTDEGPMLTAKERVDLFSELAFKFDMNMDRAGYFVSEGDQASAIAVNDILCASEMYHRLKKYADRYGQMCIYVSKTETMNEEALEKAIAVLRHHSDVVDVRHQPEHGRYVLHLRSTLDLLKEIVERLEQIQRVDIMRVECDDDPQIFMQHLNNFVSEVGVKNTLISGFASRARRIEDAIGLKCARFDDIRNAFRIGQHTTLIIDRAHGLDLYAWKRILFDPTLDSLQRLVLVGNEKCQPNGLGNLFYDMFSSAKYHDLPRPNESDTLFAGIHQNKIADFIEHVDEIIDRFREEGTKWTLITTAYEIIRIMKNAMRTRKMTGARIMHVRDVRYDDGANGPVLIHVQGMNQSDLAKCAQFAPAEDNSIYLIGDRDELTLAYNRAPMKRRSIFSELVEEERTRKKLEAEEVMAPVAGISSAALSH